MPSVAPPPFLGFDSFALGFARVIFLVSTIASFAIVCIAAALLLALAPLFVAFLLFDGTRGLSEGWAKALIATALGSLAIAVAVGIELARSASRRGGNKMGRTCRSRWRPVT